MVYSADNGAFDHPLQGLLIIIVYIWKIPGEDSASACLYLCLINRYELSHYGIFTIWL